MKRSVDFTNSVDGSTLKKIKKLTFLIQKDEEEVSENVPSLTNKHSMKNAEDSSSESDSEEESVASLSDNDEVLNDEDRTILEKFNNPKVAKDVVDGMQEAREEIASHLDFDDEGTLDFDQVEGLQEHLDELKTVLRVYKISMVYPKTVKVLPQTENWTYILDEIDFPSWSSAAVKKLSDQFKAKGGDEAEIFYTHYLLPYVRENITQNKKLDNLLFQVLKEALYRRKEFIKGILMPWCQDNIEGKEAEVLSNIIKNATVKSDAGFPAMLWITSIEYSKGRLSVLNSFLEKKYLMPFKLMTAIIDYFYKTVTENFQEHYTEKGQMPLSWFKALNLFVSLNYMHLNADDLKKVSKICKVHKHDKVTPAIQGYLKMAKNQMETN